MARGKQPEGPDRRWCSRIKRDGKRCEKIPIRGGTVCMSHGGAANHVRQAARARLDSLLDPALKVLDKVMAEQALCIACEKPCGHLFDNSSAVKASNIVLDRTGFGPRSHVEVEQADLAWLKHLTDEELDTVIELMDRAKARAQGEVSDEEDVTH